jgi:hypothetical protein
LALAQLQRAAGLPAQTIARVELEQWRAADRHGHPQPRCAALGSLFVESVAQQVLHLSEMPVPLVR